MVEQALIDKIKERLDEIVETKQLVCRYNLSGEINYVPLDAEKDLVQSNILFGTATKNNDLSEKYTQNFVINIFSELNGCEMAKSLFTELFLDMNRKFFNLNGYRAKIILTSPVIMQQFTANVNGYITLLTMSGTMEYSSNLLVEATYKMAYDDSEDFVISPRQPQIVKDAMGGNDTLITGKTIFNKSSQTISHQFTLVAENNDLFYALLDEVDGTATHTYKLKIKRGNRAEKTYNNLCAVMVQVIYDENNGDNVISLNLKEV